MYGIAEKTSEPPFFMGRDMIVGDAVWFPSRKQAEAWLSEMCSMLQLRQDKYVVLPKPKGRA